MELDMKIGAKKGTVGKLPSKKTINLAQREKHTESLLTLGIGIVVIAVLVICTAKFGVIDQYARLSAAESRYNKVHSDYVSVMEALENYDDVEAEYRTYSRKWLHDGEDSTLVSVDRALVLDLLEDKMRRAGTVNSISVQESAMMVSMSDMNLSEISRMMADIKADPIVQSATLTIAETENDTTEAKLDFVIVVALQPVAEEGEQ